MSDILILNAHPGRNRLAHALADAYGQGAESAGARVAHVRLAELTFDPVLHAGYEGEQPLEPDLVAAQAAIAACRHLVVVTPLWWGTDPALLRGFFDRVLQPGWAFRYGARGLPEGLLRGRSARVIRTMDSPWVWYAWVMRWPGEAAMERATLRFCGFGPVERRLIHDVHAKSKREAGLAADLEATRRDGVRDARRLQNTRRPLLDGAVATR